MINIEKEEILPAKNKLLIKRIYKTKVNNIEIPYDDAEDKLILGEILSASEINEKNFKIKDKVYFLKYNFHKIETFESFLNTEIGIVSVDDIFAIVKNK